MRDVATSALERAGYGVISAAREAEALRVCERAAAAVDVLVTDLVMPGMGGVELARRIVDLRPGTPVVLMSGYTDEPSVASCENGSARTFLAKPFSPRELVGAVETALVQAESNGNGNGAHPDALDAGPRPRDGGIAKPFTCLIADDHPAVLESVSRFLESAGIVVVARVSCGEEALRQIGALRPTVAVLDVGMEPLGGMEVAQRVADAFPETRTVLFTGSRDHALLEQALDAGVRGFVLKEAPLDELVRALEAVANGGTYVDPELSVILASAHAVGSLSPLTPREREVLGLLANGMTNDKVGSALGISPETVQSHVRNTMVKLEADTRTEAVATAIRQSFIE